MGDLSIHLSLAELACKDGTPYPAKWTGTARILAEEFELIRGVWSKPIRVLSAYRTPTWNAKIGGAPNSQHVKGRALDLAPPEGVPVGAFQGVIKARMSAPGCRLRGLGLYPWGAHIDIRPTVGIVTWTEFSPSKE